MTYKECRRLIKLDVERNGKKTICGFYFFYRTGRLLYRYRITNYLVSKRMLRPLYYIERLLYHLSCIKCGCDIPSHVKIGGGVKIRHPNGIVINSKVEMGENVTILSGCVIGRNHSGVPKIGNNVYIGSHALIIGGVNIGNHVDIGAGAIVTHDVPDNAVVICDSAHILKIKEPMNE